MCLWNSSCVINTVSPGKQVKYLSRPDGVQEIRWHRSIDLSTMYYPSILLCTVVLYFLGGKQRKFQVGGDPLRHWSFGVRSMVIPKWYGVKSKLVYSSLGTNWLAKTEKGKPQVYQFPSCTKSKNNPDEVQPKSQPELIQRNFLMTSPENVCVGRYGPLRWRAFLGGEKDHWAWQLASIFLAYARSLCHWFMHV